MVADHLSERVRRRHSRHEIRHQQAGSMNVIHSRGATEKTLARLVDNRGVSDGSEIVTPERLSIAVWARRNASSEEQARAKRRKD